MTWTEFESEYAGLASDALRANYATYVQKLGDFLAHIDDCSWAASRAAELERGLEFDTWYSAAKKTVSSMVGSGRLDWSRDRKKRLGQQLTLFRRFAANENAYLTFSTNFMYAGSRFDDIIREINSQLFEPFSRDLLKDLSQHAPAVAVQFDTVGNGFDLQEWGAKMPARIFVSYAHSDEAMKSQVDKQLEIMRRAGLVEVWHDRCLIPGELWDRRINDEIEKAEIILLLVSTEFLSSNYVNDVEIKRAMQRHDDGSACIIPVVLRPCQMELAPFAKIQALPTDLKPITMWPNPDEAYLNVARGIRAAISKVAKPSPVPRPEAPAPSSFAPSSCNDTPRSGNLRIKHGFTEHDQDTFKRDAFAYIARYIENSLVELAKRHADIRVTHRQIDANRFTAAIYRGGRKLSACTIYVGGMLDAISYSNEENGTTDRSNGMLTVKADDQELFLEPLMMDMWPTSHDGKKLSMQGSAEVFWGKLIEPLQ